MEIMLAQKIKDGLIKKGMTRGALAAALGVPNGTVSQWTLDKAKPRFDTFNQINAI